MDFKNELLQFQKENDLIQSGTSDIFKDISSLFEKAKHAASFLACGVL